MGGGAVLFTWFCVIVCSWSFLRRTHQLTTLQLKCEISLRIFFSVLKIYF